MLGTRWSWCLAVGGIALLGGCEAPYDAREAKGESVSSAIKNCPEPPCSDPEPDPTPSDPAPQPSLSAAKRAGAPGIEVKWANVPTNVKRTLWRQLSISWDCSQLTPAARVELATIPSGSTQVSFVDAAPGDLKSRSRYFYFLSWPSGNGSKEISALIDFGSHPGLSFKASIEDTDVPDFTTERRVQFDWSDNVITEQQFVVERRLGPPESTSYKEVFKIGGQYNATCRTYVGYEYGVKAGAPYCYRLKAIGNSGAATYSDLSCVVIPEPGCPDNPGGQAQYFPFCVQCFDETWEQRQVKQYACDTGDAFSQVIDQFPGCGYISGNCP